MKTEEVQPLRERLNNFDILRKKLTVAEAAIRMLENETSKSQDTQVDVYAVTIQRGFGMPDTRPYLDGMGLGDFDIREALLPLFNAHADKLRKEIEEL